LNLNIEYEQEEDRHWLAEVIRLPGVLFYGDTPDQAMVKVEALALVALAEKDDIKPEYDLNSLRVRKAGSKARIPQKSSQPA
jgi:predicted RNase H-like HicB family nuclease